MSVSLDWKKGVDLFFTEGVQRRAVFVVQLLLLLLLAAALARLTWLLLDDGGAPTAAPPVLASTAAAAPATAGRSWNIARWNLFGVKPAQVVQQPTLESLPETRLNLTLRGVVAAVGGEGGGAIISAPGRDETFYAVTTQVPGGAVPARSIRTVSCSSVVVGWKPCVCRVSGWKVPLPRHPCRCRSPRRWWRRARSLRRHLN